jgi:hypothetical protein
MGAIGEMFGLKGAHCMSEPEIHTEWCAACSEPIIPGQEEDREVWYDEFVPPCNGAVTIASEPRYVRQIKHETVCKQCKAECPRVDY